MWLTNGKRNNQKKWPSSSMFLLLDRPDCQYSVGEKIHGKLVFDPKYIVSKEQFIQIQFFGEVKIYPRLFCLFRKPLREIVIKEIISFQDDHINLSWKKNEIPFMFHIPEHLPGSLKNVPRCSIMYQIVAMIGYKQQDQVETFIYSNPNVSFNRLLEPLITGCHRNIGWINSKMAYIRCELLRTGYQVGSEIPIKCMIDNRSTKSMSLEIKLRQKIQWNKSYSSLHKEHNSILCYSKDLVQKFVTNVEPYCIVQHTTTLTLPSLIPIVYNTSRLIQITYQIEVELKIPWHYLNLRCKLPIILTNQNNFKNQCLMKSNKKGRLPKN